MLGKGRQMDVNKRGKPLCMSKGGNQIERFETYKRGLKSSGGIFNQTFSKKLCMKIHLLRYDIHIPNARLPLISLRHRGGEKYIVDM